MHIQGREFRFDDMNITIAYFSDELDLNFDERFLMWLGDDCPYEDSFNDFESFTLREKGGVLIVAVSNLTGKEMKLVNELMSISLDDHVSLLIHSDSKRVQSRQFDAVITSTYDLVNSIYDLAFSIYTGSHTDEGTRDISDLDAVIRQSRKGVLVSYWDDRKSKNLITPYDLVEVWPFPLDETSKVSGMYTWFNPANYKWSDKTIGRFIKFGVDELNCKHMYGGSGKGYDPEYSRMPIPDVIQLIMT